MSVGKLLLNVSNYRIVKQTSQKGARDAIIDEQGKKLVTLAKDILANGTNPSDLPIVIDTEDGDHNFIVIEGNRRLTSINLLMDPELAKGTPIHAAFVKLSKSNSDAIPKVLYCSIAPNRKTALMWADRKHANGLGGAGTEHWTAMSKARAQADQGVPVPELDVVNFVLTKTDLDADLRHHLEGSKFNLTTLERLVTTKELQDSLGLKLDAGQLVAENDMGWVKSVLADIVSIIASSKHNGKKWTERDIESQEKRLAFTTEIALRHKGKKAAKAGWTVSASPKKIAVAPKQVVKPTTKSTPSTEDQPNLIPKKFKLELPAGKINDIFAELKNLDATKYRHAISVLFRVFIDLTLDAYIKKHNIELPKNKNNKVFFVTIRRKLGEVTDMQFNTPLRYPGGKGKLTDFIKLVFEQNDLLDGHYAEAYAGGAGIAMTLLVHSYASRVHLNDLNKSVYSFWRCVLDQPDELCKSIRDVKVTMDEWRRQKAIQKDAANQSTLELGFSTFFLNRTNRSGILLGGVIGGKEQDGEWLLDARFNKADLIRRIEKIALYRSRVRLYNQDAATFITDVLPTLPQRSLTYLDPPYYVKGGDLYENHYRHDDHVAVAKLVKKKIKLPWIVSYDHAPEIMAMYRDCPTITYGISYSAQDRYKGAEAMFFSKKLIIPDVENPSNYRAA